MADASATPQPAAGAAAAADEEQVQVLQPIVVGDDARYSKDAFVLPSWALPHVDSILLPGPTIEARTERLALQILKDYTFKGRTPHLIGVLNGAVPFFNMLTRALQRLHAASDCAVAPFTSDFIRASSYIGDKSSGKVTVGGMKIGVAGRHVLLVEDIVDTGCTLAALAPRFKSLGATSVRTVAMVEKRLGGGRVPEYKAAYCGFSIPDAFVIGCGLDYNETFRALPHVCVISQSGIAAFATKD